MLIAHRPVFELFDARHSPFISARVRILRLGQPLRAAGPDDFVGAEFCTELALPPLFCLSLYLDVIKRTETHQYA